MKGLLLKDWYMITRYCRSLILIDVVFIAASLFAPDIGIFLIYPCLFAAMIPVTLHSYDEREKWHVYSAALPVSRAQYVSVKYILGLLSVGAALLVTIFAHGIAELLDCGGVAAMMPAPLLAGIAAFSLLTPAIVLPLMLRFGVEKGRIGYYIVIGVVCAAMLMLMNEENVWDLLASGLSLAAVCAITLALYAASWLLSISLYKKREL